MGFDPTKVQFSAEELTNIQNADTIYETVAPHFADGFDWTDLTSFMGVIVEIRALAAWLIQGSKTQLGYKLITLGTGLVRDNEFLG